MTDIVSTETRSRMMSGIRGKDTKPELLVRRQLHAAGFRYRVNDTRLAGKPDLVFPKWNAVLFVNGCFWHAHGCHLFKLPKTRPEFWKNKLTRNSDRDERNRSALLAADWRVGVVWECALKGAQSLPLQEMTTTISEWLQSSRRYVDVRGTL